MKKTLTLLVCLMALLAILLAGCNNSNSETDWNEYLQALNTAGINDYLTAAQMCYTRMYKSGT